MKYFFFIVVQLISCHCLLWAQDRGNASYQRDLPPDINVANAEINNQEITISVSGLLNAKADTYVAFFHVLQVGETAESTDSLMSARIGRFKRNLAKSAVDTATEFHTDLISFVPKYDFNVVNKLFSKTYNEVPDGFELQKNLIIRYKNPSYLDAIVRAAAEAEIYDLVKVDYFIADVKKQYDQLYKQCLEVLQERIRSYQAIGVRLDTAKRTFADDFATILPENRYDSYQAVARPSIDAIKRSGNSSVIKFKTADLTPSSYYRAVPYDEYDVVINPVVDQPMVQLTYQVLVKFFLNTEPPAVKRDYYFIGPNGQIQMLDIKSK